MKAFFLSAKIFYKNRALTILLFLFLGLLHFNFIKAFQGLLSYNQPAFVFLSETLKVSIFCTAFFMLLSYELFSKLKTSGLEECLTATRHGRLRLFCKQFLFIVVLNLAVVVTAMVYNLVYLKALKGQWSYILHAFCSINFYLFLVPLVGVVIGYCISLVFKRLPGYFLMVAFILLSSRLTGMIAFTISDATGYEVNITPFFDLFNLYAPNLDYAPLYGFGISLLPYKFTAVFFWLFAAAAIALFKISNTRPCGVKIAAFVCAALCVLNCIGFYLPASKLDMSYRLDGALFSDHSYYAALYNEKYPDEQSAGFQVLNYNLNLSVKNKLHAKAKLQIEQNNLQAYPFTLYHNFKIKKITDQTNTPLRFEQKNDHVTVYASNAPLTELCFEYSGYNARFYSNTQGIFLPGYFAYYPIPGYRNVYSSDLQSYAKTLLPNNAMFHLTVNYNKQIFTNLSQNGSSFSGKTNGLTILSGFYNRAVVQGIEIVYPCFNTAEFKTEQLKQDVAAFVKVRQNDPVEKILVVPGVNQHADSIVAFSNYLTAEQVMALPERYVFTKMLDFKQTLYFYQQSYLEDRASFNEIVASEKNFPPEMERSCTLFQEKIESLGEERVMTQTTKYIFNNSDTRSIIEFLNQLN